MSQKYYVAFYKGIDYCTTEAEHSDFFVNNMRPSDPVETIECHDSKESALRRKKELEKEKYVFNVRTNAR